MQSNHLRNEPSSEVESKRRKIITITTQTIITTDWIDENGNTSNHDEQVLETSHNDDQKILNQLDTIRSQILDKSTHQTRSNPFGHSQKLPLNQEMASAPSASITTHSALSSGRTLGTDQFANRTTASGTQPATSIEDDPYRAHEKPIDGSIILERGHIYFFYRPKVELSQVTNFDEIQKTFIVLSRHSLVSANPTDDPLFRIIRIGKKKLPSTEEHNRFWGIVEEASDDMSNLERLIDEDHYTTITQGERTNFASRLVGGGVYAIVQHKNATHLAYVLEMPKEIGETQKLLNIQNEGSFYIALKNPTTYDHTEYASTMPSWVNHSFKGRTWNPALPIELLNFKGMEMVLIGESNDLKSEFGKVGAEIEREGRLIDQSLFSELKEAHNVPLDPMLSGRLV
eukprot:TRINITY_DN8567_c0_g1_i1.p1 TRINITY_DN8567_c0_g1~~TRINITY_DN8567_c0_g1_i1.p1  ORF type:complete len:400 (-),score=124.40 TRINITY_DN8567_c0_g1_i1:255-1454(-)